MKRNLFTLAGVCYAVFAIVCFMEAVDTRPSYTITEPEVVAQADQGDALRSSRLYQSDAKADRSNYWLTIWVTKSCYGCEQQKAEVPALQAAGYNVVLRKGPPGRWIKSFPHIIINRDRLNGERVTELAGFHTLAEIDEVLQIGVEEEEEVENDEDYNIFSPKAQVNAINLVVWLNDSEECDRQYDEIAKLRKLGFSANVYVVGKRKPPRHIVSFPTIVLIDNRRDSVCVAVWRKFVTAEEILDALH